jgi:hypothetical protein
VKGCRHLMNKRTRGLLACAAVALVLSLGSQAFAQTVFGEKLGFVPVNNANRATITGTGWVRATLTGMTLVVEGEFWNLSSPATVAHIHLAPRGQHGPVVLPLQVPNATSGTISGTFTLTDAQLAELLAINLYVNVHSELSPRGEVRAWLVPAE